MKSTFKIIWTDEAVQGLKNTINQIEINWPQKEVVNFSRLLDKQLKLLQKTRASAPIWINPKTFVSVLSPGKQHFTTKLRRKLFICSLYSTAGRILRN